MYPKQLDIFNLILKTKFLKMYTLLLVAITLLNVYIFKGNSVITQRSFNKIQTYIHSGEN